MVGEENLSTSKGNKEYLIVRKPRFTDRFLNSAFKGWYGFSNSAIGKRAVPLLKGLKENMYRYRLLIGLLVLSFFAIGALSTFIKNNPDIPLGVMVVQDSNISGIVENFSEESTVLRVDLSNKSEEIKPESTSAIVIQNKTETPVITYNSSKIFKFSSDLRSANLSFNVNTPIMKVETDTASEFKIWDVGDFSTSGINSELSGYSGSLIVKDSLILLNGTIRGVSINNAALTLSKTSYLTASMGNAVINFNAVIRDFALQTSGNVYIGNSRFVLNDDWFTAKELNVTFKVYPSGRFDIVGEVSALHLSSEDLDINIIPK